MNIGQISERLYKIIIARDRKLLKLIAKEYGEDTVVYKAAEKAMEKLNN